MANVGTWAWMKHVIDHPLDPPTAKKVADRAFDEYRNRYPTYEPKLAWTGERHARVTFNAQGVKLEGTLDIQDRTIELDLDVPFLLRVFQKKAIEVIDREVKIWIERAKAGSL
jgi:hypothetical protein